jgi:hypothetical protein
LTPSFLLIPSKFFTKMDSSYVLRVKKMKQEREMEFTGQRKREMGK